MYHATVTVQFVLVDYAAVQVQNVPVDYAAVQVQNATMHVTQTKTLCTWGVYLNHATYISPHLPDSQMSLEYVFLCHHSYVFLCRHIYVFLCHHTRAMLLPAQLATRIRRLQKDTNVAFERFHKLQIGKSVGFESLNGRPLQA